VVAGTSRARQIISLRHPVATNVRNTLMTWLTSFEFVRHKIIEEASELNIKYPHSPLNREIHQGHSAWLLGHGVHPGDRAPDGYVESGEKHSRLFCLMQDTRFHVLLLSGLRHKNTRHKNAQEALECARWVSSRYGASLGVHWIRQSAEDKPDLESAWWDSTGSVHKAYGASEPTLYLIRPDGYVAFRCQPATQADLEKYLSDLGVHQPLNP